MPPEREVRLVGVDEDREILCRLRETHPLRLVDRLAELSNGERLAEPVEVAEPVLAEDEVRLPHLPKPERDGDLANQRA